MKTARKIETEAVKSTPMDRLLAGLTHTQPGDIFYYVYSSKCSVCGKETAYSYEQEFLDDDGDQESFSCCGSLMADGILTRTKFND